MPVREADLHQFQDDRVIRTGTQPYPKKVGAPGGQQAKHVIVDPTDEMVFGTVKKSNTLGENLMRIRGEKGISRKDLALKLASNEKIIAGWENGTSEIPKAMIPRLEKALDAKLK